MSKENRSSDVSKIYSKSTVCSCETCDSLACFTKRNGGGKCGCYSCSNPQSCLENSRVKDNSIMAYKKDKKQADSSDLKLRQEICPHNGIMNNDVYNKTVNSYESAVAHKDEHYAFPMPENLEIEAPNADEKKSNDEACMLLKSKVPNQESVQQIHRFSVSYASQNSVVCTAKRLTAEVMNLPPTGNNLKYDMNYITKGQSYSNKLSFMGKLNEAYKACSCKICQCIPVTRIPAPVCDCIPCECKECPSLAPPSSHDTNNGSMCQCNGRAEMMLLPNECSACKCEPCQCIQCNNASIKSCDCEICQCLHCNNMMTKVFITPERERAYVTSRDLSEFF